MSQPFDASRSLTALEQDSTVVAVIEMSQSKWLVAAIVPGVERQPLKKLDADEKALLKLLHRRRNEAGQAGRDTAKIPPNRYFRMHKVGYFEGIDSERGIEWRCADSLSLRELLRLQTTERVPDHSWLSKTRAVYANRNRLRSAVGKAAMRRRAEIVERSFAHNLERGGMRRTWLRGRENVHKRYLIHVAGHNLGILMRLLIAAGTPKEAAARGRVLLFVVHTENTPAIVIFAAADADFAILIVAVTAEPT